MKWIVKSTKSLLKHPRIHVVEDDIELEDGHKTDYIRFEGDAGASTLIVRRKDGKILLQKEYSHPIGEVLYQFPGGGRHESETFEEAALRELSEEANLTGDVEDIGWFYVDNRRKDAKMYIFIVDGIEEKIGSLDPEEELEDFWFTEKEIDGLIKNQELIIYSALASWAVYKNYLSHS